MPIDLDMSNVKAGIQTEQVSPEWVDNNTYLRWSINQGSYMTHSSPRLAFVYRDNGHTKDISIMSGMCP